MNRCRIAALVVCQILALVLNGIAALEIPSIFSDHMVLQSDRPVTVWGWAFPGDLVTVEFAGSTANATASADGRWEAVLPSFPASADGRDPELFFFVVQLHGYGHPNRLADWPTLRAQQAEVVQSTRRAAMAVTIDLGDQTDIHPVRKQPAGERLALLARRHVYGEESVVAEATLREGVVVLPIPQGTPATEIRYAWANWPKANLQSLSGLPIAPFRTTLSD